MTAKNKIFPYAIDKSLHSRVGGPAPLTRTVLLSKNPRPQDNFISRVDTLSIRSALVRNNQQRTPPIAKRAQFDNIALERIRYFYQVDCPRAVSTTGSHQDNNEIRQYIPKKDTQDWQKISITYTNWSPPTVETHKLAPMVLLETIVPDSAQEDDHNNACEDTTKLHGIVRVRNQCFEKQVVVRYTTDAWGTYSSTNAYYVQSISPLYDEFAFDLDIAISLSSDHQATSSSQVDVAIQYNFENREFWDNNHGQNYQLLVTRHPTVPRKPTVVYPKTIKRPPSATMLCTPSSDPSCNKGSTHDQNVTDNATPTISYPTYTKQDMVRTKHFMQEVPLDNLCSTKPKHASIRHISKPCNYANLMVQTTVSTSPSPSTNEDDLTQTLIKKYCSHGQLTRQRPTLLL
ncbi:hypothetical protein NQZ79_g4412 [Umbelopsis isabellina]|nr:hypothetical protein NQZ79_g4412 [Umbelopsis isabellina]